MQCAFLKYLYYRDILHLSVLNTFKKAKLVKIFPTIDLYGFHMIADDCLFTGWLLLKRTTFNTSIAQTRRQFTVVIFLC